MTHNERSLAKLTWVIEATQGQFSLILACCNDVGVKSSLIERLRESCLVNLQTLVLQESEPALYPAIQQQLTATSPDSLIILGMESLLHLDQVLVSANQQREAFQKNFHLPLVLWVDSAIASKFLQLAPEFRNWTTTIEFVAPTPEVLIPQSPSVPEPALRENLGPGIGLSRLSPPIRTPRPARHPTSRRQSSNLPMWIALWSSVFLIISVFLLGSSWLEYLWPSPPGDSLKAKDRESRKDANPPRLPPQPSPPSPKKGAQTPTPKIGDLEAFGFPEVPRNNRSDLLTQRPAPSSSVPPFRVNRRTLQIPSPDRPRPDRQSPDRQTSQIADSGRSPQQFPSRKTPSAPTPPLGGRFSAPSAPAKISVPPTPRPSPRISTVVPVKPSPVKPASESQTVSQTAVVSPSPSSGKPLAAVCPGSIRPLSLPERRYAAAAWSYFQTNYEAKTGLVSDRRHFKAATLWGLGDYLAALQAAKSLKIIPTQEFDQRTQRLLETLKKLPLFRGEMPGRSYNIQTLQAIDDSGVPKPRGNGWSALDISRMLVTLYTLKTCHPEYTQTVDQVVLTWSYSQIVKNGKIVSAIVTQDSRGRVVYREPDLELGYDNYAALAFQLWGFEVNRSIRGTYETAKVEGFAVPIQYRSVASNSQQHPYTVSDPFVLYGLEFGFDPRMRFLVQSVLLAQAERYRRTGILTGAATTLIEHPPYKVHNTLIGKGEPWATLSEEGQFLPHFRMVSTAVAFAYYALFPEQDYAQQLWKASADLYNPLQGYYEGFYEKTGKPAVVFSSRTNSLILQSLLYQTTNQQPLTRPAPTTNSTWWRAISIGKPGRGLPTTATPKARFISDALGDYWTSRTSR